MVPVRIAGARYANVSWTNNEKSMLHTQNKVLREGRFTALFLPGGRLTLGDRAMSERYKHESGVTVEVVFSLTARMRGVFRDVRFRHVSSCQGFVTNTLVLDHRRPRQCHVNLQIKPKNRVGQSHRRYSGTV